MIKQLVVQFEEYSTIDELSEADAEILRQARAISVKAYAPYSKFLVGAAARLQDGSIYTGTNQENVSFPVGMCAEQSLILGLTTRFESFIVESLAVSYTNLNGESNSPISPCGKCRQFLAEFEQRMKKPIRLIMSGQTGKVQIVNSVIELLPLVFDSDNLLPK